jgi:tartrate dehydratase alpha subunit/fumarate hydratase class I-like protein
MGIKTMIGIAKVKIELSNGGQRLFKFIVKGEGSEDIESKVEQFAKTKAKQHRCERVLTWEVKLKDRLTHLGFIPYKERSRG